MQYTKRRTDLIDKRDIHDDKAMIVLSWLAEFRYCDIAILQRRLGDAKRLATYSLITKLLERELIKVFHNSTVQDHGRLFAATQKGLNMVDPDDPQKVISVSKFNQTSTAKHHLLAQHAVLERCDEFTKRVYSEFSVGYSKDKIRPDGIIETGGFDGDDFWTPYSSVAIEFERRAKSDPRIEDAFFRHHLNMIEKQYTSVCYVFDSDKVRQKYEALFNQPEWTRYDFGGKNGKPMKTGVFDKSKLSGSFTFTMLGELPE